MTVLTSQFHPHVQYAVKPDSACSFCGKPLTYPCVHYNHGRSVFMCAGCVEKSEGLLLDMHAVKRAARRPDLAEEKDRSEALHRAAAAKAFVQKYPKWKALENEDCIQLMVQAEAASPEKFAAWSAAEPGPANPV